MTGEQEQVLLIRRRISAARTSGPCVKSNGCVAA